MLIYESTDLGVRLLEGQSSLASFQQRPDQLRDLTAKVDLVDKHVKATKFFTKTFDELLKWLAILGCLAVGTLVVLGTLGAHFEGFGSVFQELTAARDSSFYSSGPGIGPGASFSCKEVVQGNRTVLECDTLAPRQLKATKKRGRPVPPPVNLTVTQEIPGPDPSPPAQPLFPDLEFPDRVQVTLNGLDSPQYFLTKDTWWSRLGLPIRMMVIAVGLISAAGVLTLGFKYSFEKEFSEDRKKRILEVSQKTFASFGGTVNLKFSLQEPVTYCLFLESETGSLVLPAVEHFATPSPVGLVSPESAKDKKFEESMVSLQQLANHSAWSIK